MAQIIARVKAGVKDDSFQEMQGSRPDRLRFRRRRSAGVAVLPRSTGSPNIAARLFL
jgi:hypothetical protein